MKAKKRITAIVMALVMMLAVQPMYGNVALAAIAITGSDEFSAVSDNTEYTIENNTSCTSISITGSGNVLKVSGVNRIGGRVSGGFTFKLVEADWSSSEPMLSLDSFEEQTSFDVSGLTFTNITGIESGSRKTLIYSRSDVGGKIRSLDRSTNGVTNVTVPGIGIANNGVKMSLDLIGHFEAAGSDAEGYTLSFVTEIVNPNGIDISNWDYTQNAGTLDGFCESAGGVSINGKLPVGLTEEKTILTSSRANFFEGVVKDSSVEYGVTHSFSISPTPGVLMEGTQTGGVKISDDKRSLVYKPGTTTVNKITFTNVEWKDTGALFDHGTTLQGVSFDGATIDTTNINFTNIRSLNAGRVMTLISGFGTTVGTITGTKYKVGSSFEGEGIAFLEQGNLCFLAQTEASDGSINDPAGPVDPFSHTINEPKVDDAKGWKAIENKISLTPEGGSLDVDMKDTTNLPSNAMEAIKDKDVTLVLRMKNGVSWTVNGKDNTGETQDMNMGVELNTNSVPDSVVKGVAGGNDSMQIKTDGNKPPKIKGKVTIPVLIQHSDLMANLYQYVQKSSARVAEIRSSVKKESGYTAVHKDEQEADLGFLKYMSCGVVKADGTVDLDFDGTSLTQDDTSGQSFVIVFAEKSLDPNATAEDTDKLTLKSKVKNGKVSLSWNKIKGAKKYRIFQKVAGVYLPVKTIKASKPAKATVSKALTKIKKNGKTDYEIKTLIVGKKYTFAVCAYVNNKWTKFTKTSKATVKVRK